MGNKNGRRTPVPGTPKGCSAPPMIEDCSREQGTNAAPQAPDGRNSPALSWPLTRLGKLRTCGLQDESAASRRISLVFACPFTISETLTC